MRHRKANKKLSRKTAPRKVLFKDLAAGMLRHQRITTTFAKAKEMRKVMDKLITLGKKGGVNNRRKAYELLNDRDLIFTLFNEVAPRFKDRVGGYTRVIPANERRGDGVQMAILELTEMKIVEPAPVKKKKKVKDAAPGKAETKGKAPKKTPDEAKKEEKEPEKFLKKEKPAHTLVKDKSKKKGFFKDLRKYFRRKADGRTGG